MINNKKMWWIVIPLVLFIVMPIVRLVIVSFQVGSECLSLKAYLELWQDPNLATAISNTFYIAFVSTIIALVLGTVCAYITERTDIPGRQFWRLIFLFPMLVPSYIMSLAWMHWIGSVGLLTKWWKLVFGQELWQLAGLNGITILMAITHMPIIYLLVRTAINTIPPELNDAARIVGAKQVAIIKRIILPLIIPAMVSGALLCFASAIDNFGIPAFIGIPSGITVLSTMIYQKVIGLGDTQFEQAAALSVLTGIAAMIPVYLQGKLFHGPKFRRENLANKQVIYSLGWLKIPIFILLCLWQFVTTIGPFLSMLFVSITPAYGIDLTVNNWTLVNYKTLLTDIPAVTAGLQNSILLAGSVTVIIMILAWPLAKAIANKPTDGTKMLDAISSIPFCLPGMVVALAVLLTWLNPLPGISFSLYGGGALLLMAYIPRFYTLGVRAWVSAWARFSPSLEEAGRIAGANKVTVATRIVLPNFRQEAFSGSMLIFLLAFTELTLSAILAGSQNPTLGVVIFNLESAGQALESAALGMFLTVFTLILTIVLGQKMLASGRHE